MKTLHPLHGIARTILTPRTAGLLLLSLAACPMFLSTAEGQTVPQLLNYQGRVADSTGTGLGTGTPINRKILFRIYDASTAGTKLWSEEQTVILSNGEFTVLLGQGIAATYNAVSEAALHIPLDTLFTSSGVGRYLGVTVDNGDNTFNASDVEITPRQQITTTAYSFRARAADTIAGSSDLTINPTSAAITGGSVAANYGLGWYGTGRPFNGLSVDGPVLYGFGGGGLGSMNGVSQNLALRWNAAGQVGLGIGGDTLAGTPTAKLVLQGDDATAAPQQLLIRGATDTARKLQIGYQTTGNYASLQAFSGAGIPAPVTLNPAGGNIGIGTTTPGFPLTFASSLGDKISLYGQSGNHWGLGVQSGTLQIHSDAVGGDVAFGYGSSAAMTETMRIKGNGKTIIQGTSAIDTSNFTGLSFQYQSGTGEGAIMSSYDDGFGSLAFYTKSASGQPVTKRMVISPAGLVGINNNVPGSTLSVGGTGDFSGKLSAASFASDTNFTAPSTSAFGIRWEDGTSTLKANIFRWTSDNRLYITNNGTSNLTGVYLASGGTSLTSTSDERLKSNIEPVTNILDKIKDIRVVGFNMATLSVDKTTGEMNIDRHTPPRKTKSGKVIKDQIGTIAQDWIPNFPELVIEPETDKQFYGLNYDRIGIVAIGAVKELNKIVKDKDTEIADLKKRIADLEANDKTREDRLVAIERKLSGDSPAVAARPVVLKKSPANR
jgi:hypothetical protein